MGSWKPLMKASAGLSERQSGAKPESTWTRPPWKTDLKMRLTRRFWWRLQMAMLRQVESCLADWPRGYSPTPHGFLGIELKPRTWCKKRCCAFGRPLQHGGKVRR